MKKLKIYIPKMKNPVETLDKAVTIAGIACIFYGIYKIYQPIAWVVLGIILAFPGMPRKAVK